MSEETTRVCVSVCEKNFSALESAYVRASEWADFIELRLDCIEEEPEGLAQLLNNVSCPVILTFRPSEQGGRRTLSREARVAFWKKHAPRGEAVWWDVEADLAQDISPDWSRTIVSHHDFSGVPPDRDDIYDRLAQTPARVLKIAVQAN